MNLSVDQMDVLNFRLTEVSLELLGNNFYDIFGRKCDTMGSLYRSKSGQTANDCMAESDLVAALKVSDVFSGGGGERSDGIMRSGNAICKNEQNSDDTSSDESDEVSGQNDRQLQNRSIELKINKILNDVDAEYNRLSICSESTKMKYFITNKHRMETDYEDEYEICNRFHAQENAELMAQSDAFIKLIKYIKCDSRNASKMGDIAATILKVKDHLSDAASTRK